MGKERRRGSESILISRTSALNKVLYFLFLKVMVKDKHSPRVSYRLMFSYHLFSENFNLYENRLTYKVRLIIYA